MTYPLHLLEIRENGIKDTIEREAQRATQAAVRGAMPAVSREIQTIAEAQAVNVVNMIGGAIPNEAEMIRLGKQIARAIESAINQNLLPQLFNRYGDQAPATLGGVGLDLEALYNQGLSQVPPRVTFEVILGQTITLDIKRIVQAALPLAKFKEIAGKIDPLVNTIETEAVPILERKAKTVAAFTLCSGFAAGALFMYGMSALYHSYGRD